MARAFKVNGECMVKVKGNVNSAIAALSELGLVDANGVTVTPEFRHDPINIDAYGGQIPPEKQYMLAQARVNMGLIHLDRDVLDACLREAMGGAPAVGQTARAGTLMGGNAVRFAAGNHYVGLNILSPVDNKPWRFLHAHLEGSTPVNVGTRVSTWQLTWTAIPYQVDPWNAGNGAAGVAIWDHVLDT
jgi:hypothetical protein